jgi:small basic protein
MDNMLDTLFGPLDKKFCDYFYILSILGFVLLAISLVSSVMVGLSKRRGLDFYMQMFSVAVGYGLFYFQNRLLHSMCVGSIQ